MEGRIVTVSHKIHQTIIDYCKLLYAKKIKKCILIIYFVIILIISIAERAFWVANHSNLSKIDTNKYTLHQDSATSQVHHRQASQRPDYYSKL
jgi:hypothetical protein